MNFYGTGQPLTRAGLSKVLAILGLGPNDAGYIWTVVEVETAGLIIPLEISSGDAVFYALCS